jgi:hypothetical protein
MARPRIYASDAERVAAFRARNNTVKFTVDIDADLVAGLDEYLRFKDKTKREVIEGLLRNQLLRKR